MAASNLNERTGLEYLIKAGRLPEPATSEAEPDTAGSGSSSSASSSASAPATPDIGAFAARAVLHAVEQLGASDPDKHEARLSDVAEEVGVGADLLLPVVRSLADADLVALRDMTKFGDGLVQLTDKARALGDDPVELMKALGL